MRIPLKPWMVLSLSLGTGIPARAHPFGEDGQGSMAGATIRVYDLAHVDPAILERARQVAERVFLNAGIELRWIDCLGGAGHESRCCQPPALREIVLRIIRRSEQAIDVTGRLTNGQAIRTDPEGGSGLVTIFYERTEMIAREVQNEYSEMKVEAGRGIVLGHFMAHEIGHILLPTNSHSAAGIMKEKLDRTEWGQAVRGTLLFTRQEAELIRQRLELIARRGPRLSPGGSQ